MKSFLYILFLLLLSVLSLPAIAQTDILHFKSDVTDTIFGKVVHDPYRWMEDLNSDRVKDWLKAQQVITDNEKSTFGSRFSTAKSDIIDFSAYQYADAKKTGPWYFQCMYSALNSRLLPVLYYKTAIDGRNYVAFDPNYIPGKITYGIVDWKLSDDNRYLAIALSPSGSDWREIWVRDLKKEKNSDDKIEWVKFSSIVWWKDGFFYARFHEPSKNAGQLEALSGQELFYHKLGAKQESDVMITIGSGELAFEKTSNGRYLIINETRKIHNNWYTVACYKDLNEGLYGEMNLIAQSPAKDKISYEVVDFMNGGFIIISNYQAPRKRVLYCALDSVNHFQEIIPQSAGVLQSVNYVHHELVAIYFTGGKYEVNMFDTMGRKLSIIQFEAGISIRGFEGSPDDSETIYYQNTFYMPTMISRYDFKTRKSYVVEKTKVTYDATKYTTELVNVKSKDGTLVPMYLVHRKDLRITGNNPVILYGYGAFGIPLTPEYSYSNILFFDNQGILAVPMIRGGGELGEEWHNDGKGLHKQNSFDDFIASAEYLINEGYTSKAKLAIMGGSNGGLLVGAVITQRPDLFQVAVAQGGLFDMVRYPRFTGGKFWKDEYGSPDNATDFENLYSYSPLHHVRNGINYPATLLVTGRNDDRVPPLHSYKFLATLQEKSAGDAPHILFFQEDAGHNGAQSAWDRNYERAFVLAFIFTEMNLPLKAF